MSSHIWKKERGHIFKYKLFPIDLNLCSIYCWFQTNGYSLEVALQGNAASKAPMWTKIFIWDVKIKNFVDNSFDSADREVKAVFIFLVHLLKQSGKKGFFRELTRTLQMADHLHKGEIGAKAAGSILTIYRACQASPKHSLAFEEGHHCMDWMPHQNFCTFRIDCRSELCVFKRYLMLEINHW